MVSSDIPVVDLTNLHRKRETARELAKTVDTALREIGFFVVVGHGVDWDRVLHTDKVCRQFFDLPQSVKQSVHNQGTPFRGYVGYGGENLALTSGADTAPDWKENFIMGRTDLRDPYFSLPSHQGTFKPNVWPSPFPELKPAMEWYYHAMESLATTLMSVLAVALELPQDYFRNCLDRHDNTMRAANYPHQQSEPLPGQLRAGAHTDYGPITIVKVDDAPGGLQVMRRGGAWVDIPQVDKGLVVNIGDLMMTWTNERWLSNWHRVVNPQRAQQQSDGESNTNCTRRQSLVYFVNCNPDTRVECLPTCHGPGNPPRHPPIFAGEHRRMKINKSAQPLSRPH